MPSHFELTDVISWEWKDINSLQAVLEMDSSNKARNCLGPHMYIRYLKCVSSTLKSEKSIRKCIFLYHYSQMLK